MMDSHISHVMTLSNSIIGVGVLAMPFCFKQCGIILSIVLLIFSSLFSRLACHFLLKSSIMTRRRTFEFLAFHTFGGLGKFVVEIGIIGFLVGTCIAFFVIMGDLGPAIIAKISGTNVTSVLRISVLIFFAIFCILPLGLLKNVDSLSSVCTATIGFYFCLVLKIIFESVPHILSGDWMGNVVLWRPDGILQCLPIFSMALFCQTQLFEIYEAIPNASLEKMNELIRSAVNICTCLYIFVGMFGYIAFYNQMLTGNILMRFLPSITTDIMKLGFVLSVAFSFPLVIFPCRASLYSLLYKPSNTPYDMVNQTRYIPPTKFISITIVIISVSLIIAILIPNIELVLGLVGSTIGVMICILFPATTFVCISTKNTNERILAQIMLCIGIIVMVLGTYANLYAIEKIDVNAVTDRIMPVAINKDNFAPNMNSFENMPVHKGKANTVEKLDIPPMLVEIKVEEKAKNEGIVLKETRLEPPQPEEPADVPREAAKEEIKNDAPKIEQRLEEIKLTSAKVAIGEAATVESVHKSPEENAIDSDAAKKKEEVDIEAIKREDKELQENEKQLRSIDDKEKEKKEGDLMKKLEKHREVQQKLVDEQKQLLHEIKLRQDVDKEKQKQEMEKMKEQKIKAVNQIKDIAEQAIKSIGKVDEAGGLALKQTNEVLQDDNNNNKNNNDDDKKKTNNSAAHILAPLSYQLGLEKQTKKQPTLQDIVGVPVQQQQQKVQQNATGSSLVPAAMQPQALNDMLQQVDKKSEKAFGSNNQNDVVANNMLANDVVQKRPDAEKQKPAAAAAGGRGELERDNLRKKRDVDVAAAAAVADKMCDKHAQSDQLSDRIIDFEKDLLGVPALQANINFKNRRK